MMNRKSKPYREIWLKRLEMTPFELVKNAKAGGDPKKELFKCKNCGEVHYAQLKKVVTRHIIYTCPKCVDPNTPERKEVFLTNWIMGFSGKYFTISLDPDGTSVMKTPEDTWRAWVALYPTELVRSHYGDKPACYVEFEKEFEETRVKD